MNFKEACIYNLKMEVEDILKVIPERYRKGVREVKNVSGGSDRIFLKIKGREEFVVIKDNPCSNDFLSYIKIQRFLYKKGLGVPEIYYKDFKRGILIVEELGETSLEIMTYEKSYKKVIDFLIDLQIKGIRGFLNLQLPYKKIFDRQKLLCETDYFKKFYLNHYRKIRGNQLLNKTFEFLADRVSELHCFFMHRDFQSKNIFIKDGKVRITDFQTAHKGPFTYDVASLLFDPYVNLSKNVIKKISRYYHEKIRRRINMRFEEFDFYLNLTGIQRLCQALAAFVKLSEVKGKKEFKKYIPTAENRIRSILYKLKFYELKSLKDIFF